jgi:undecaprenyl-diphosphatase
VTSELTYLQSGVIGVLQGATELFPVSSLGHSVLVPALIGGSWKHLVSESGADSSPYLAFIVAMHCATAAALLVFYRSKWARLVRAFVQTLRTRKIQTSEQRLSWLVIVATIPAGVIGLALEHTLRTLFAKPVAVSLFLTANGLVLYLGQRMRDRAEQRSEAGRRRGSPLAVGGPDGALEVLEPDAQLAAAGGGGDAAPTVAIRLPGGGSRPRVPAQAGGRQTGAWREAGAGRRSRAAEDLSFKEAIGIGLFQSLALLAGISRSGVTMIGGLARGLDNEDAANFSFLLATPVILAAGLFKLPQLTSSDTAGIRGPIVFGTVLAGAAAYLTTRFLVRYFENNKLTPFAIYCFVAGVLCTLRFALF